MKYLILLAPLLMTGCATYNHTITSWNGSYNVYTKEGTKLTILGNPPIKCYQKRGLTIDDRRVHLPIPSADKLIADGKFVRVDDEMDAIVVDEFGKDYVLVPYDSGVLGSEYYCVLFNSK